MPSDPKAHLLQQIRALRARLDPGVMDRVQDTVVKAQFGPTKPPASNDPGAVPYDRDRAAEVIARFLAERDDDGAFRRELLDKLGRRSR